MNSINITGRLCADPELQKTASGISYSRVTVAVKRPHSADKTDFLPVTAWNHVAEYLCQYGRKGGWAAVSGVLTADTRVMDDGTKRTYYAIQADELNLIGIQSTQTARPAPQPAPAQPAQPSQIPQERYTGPTRPQEMEFGIDDGDLPF